MTTKQNLSIYQGDTKTYNITVTDSVGSAYNLTGHTVRFTVKEDYEDSDSDALIGPKTATLTDPINGECQIKLTNTDTNVDAGTHKYDIQVDNGSDIVKTVMIGKFTITSDVTDTSY